MHLSYQLDMPKSSRWFLVGPDGEISKHLPYVQEVGEFISGPAYFTKREGLDSYLLTYTVSGRGLLHYGGKEYVLEPGSFFWIDCRSPQYYRTDPAADGWTTVWVHFFGGESPYFYDRFLMAGGSPVCRPSSEESVASLIYRLLELYGGERDAMKDLRASGILTMLLSLCVTGAAEPESTPAQRYVRSAKDYLIGHYREKITLDDLGQIVNLNKFYLQKLFKEQTGQTPNGFLTQLRLSAAKELLRSTRLPISSVAAEAGIESASYFIRQFRRFEGVTPTEYRSRWQTISQKTSN